MRNYPVRMYKIYYARHTTDNVATYFTTTSGNPIDDLNEFVNRFQPKTQVFDSNGKVCIFSIIDVTDKPVCLYHYNPVLVKNYKPNPEFVEQLQEQGNELRYYRGFDE